MEGRCHLGAICFDAPAPDRLLPRNRSLRDRAGAGWAHRPPDAFTLPGEDAAMSHDRFGTGAVDHRHRARCGCATHPLSPIFHDDGTRDPDRLKGGGDVCVMTGVDRASLPVATIDGASL